MKRTLMLGCFFAICYLYMVNPLFAGNYLIPSPDGTRIVLIKDKQIVVYQSNSNEILFKFKGTKMIAGAGISSDSEKLVFTDDSYFMTLMDLANENTVVWQSDLGEVIDIPPINSEVLMGFSSKGDQIAQINSNEAAFVDVYTGELLGYDLLSVGLSVDDTYKVERLISNTDNSFQVVHSQKLGYSTTKLSIEGYGQANKKYAYFTPDKFAKYGSWTDQRTLMYKTTGEGKYILKTYDKDIEKYNVYGISNLPGVMMRPSGQDFVLVDEDKLLLYNTKSGKKIKSIDVSAGQLPKYFFQNNVILFNPENTSFAVVDLNAAKLLNEYNASDDFAYKGTALSKGKFTKGATTIFFDDFDDNENQWYIKSSSNNSKEIVDGKYVFRNTSAKSSYSVWNNKIEIDQFRDFEIECSLKIEGRDASEVGVFWGRKPDPSRYHALYLKNQGSYGVWEYSGFWISHLKYVSSPVVKKDDYNKMRVRKTGNQLEYFVNDSLIYLMPFEGFHGSKVGFSFGKETTTYVDYLKVSYLSDAQQPSSRSYSDDFDDNRSKWASGYKEGVYNQRIEEGVFKFDNPGTKTYSKWNDRIFLDDDKDWVLETSFKFVRANSGYALALVWGRKKDAGNRYRFGIGRMGKFVIDYYDGSKWGNIAKWTSHSVVKPYQFNHLKIVKNKKKYKFYINGTLVEMAEPKYVNAYSYGSRVGFDIPPDTEAHINYIHAYYTNSRTQNRKWCNYYIPFMHPKAKGNPTGKFMLGRTVICKKPPMMFKGRIKHFAWRDKNAYSWITVYEKDEVELQRQKLKKQYNYAGYVTWNHALKCFDGCD